VNHLQQEDGLVSGQWNEDAEQDPGLEFVKLNLVRKIFDYVLKN
jgi:hypothetical protein